MDAIFHIHQTLVIMRAIVGRKEARKREKEREREREKRQTTSFIKESKSREENAPGAN